MTGSYSIKQRMREERARLAALDQHFRAGGPSSRPDPAPERRRSWGSDLGRRGSLGSVMSSMKGKGKGKEPAGTASTGTASTGTETATRPPGPSANHPYRREQRIPGSYDSYVAEDGRPTGSEASSAQASPRSEKGGLPQTRYDSRVSLNSGMDVALAGTTDRWYESTSSLGGLSTLTASVTGRSGRELREDSPVSPDVRGRSLGKSQGKEKEKQ